MAPRKKSQETPGSNPAPTQSNEKMVMIASGDDAVYGLDSKGRVFIYVEDDKRDEHGWYQLEYDETRGSNKADRGEADTEIKFVQITGTSNGLYALDEHGRTFFYDDDETGWFQLEFDDEPHELADEVED